MKLKEKSAILLIAFSLLGCSSEPNVEISIQTNQHWGTLVFNVQAISDEVIIEDVIINRGNCMLAPGTATDIERTVNLRFGESYRGYSPYCTVNDVREIELATNSGTFNFSF